MEAESPKEKPNAIQRLRDNLPVISIALLIIGTLNLVIYYWHFEIDILSYLDITEVLQIQFTLFAISAAALAFFSVWAAILVSIGPSYEDMIEARIWFQATHSPEQMEAARIETAKIEKSYKKKKLIGGIIIGAFIFIYLIKLSLNFSDDDNGLISMISVFIVGFIISYAYLFLLDLELVDASFLSPIPKLVIARQAGLFIFLMYGSGMVAHVKAIQHRALISVSEVVIVTEKATVTTDKNFRFIGKTKNFTFFYDIKNKKASIYSNDDIKTTSISVGTDYRTAEEKEPKPISYYINKLKSLTLRH